MTDERRPDRYTIYVCPECGYSHIARAHPQWLANGPEYGGRLCSAREDDMTAVVVVPVSSVVPITRLRAWIENERAVRAALHPYSHTANMDLAELEALLVECASNPNNEGTR